MNIKAIAHNIIDNAASAAHKTVDTTSDCLFVGKVIVAANVTAAAIVSAKVANAASAATNAATRKVHEGRDHIRYRYCAATYQRRANGLNEEITLAARCGALDTVKSTIHKRDIYESAAHTYRILAGIESN